MRKFHKNAAAVKVRGFSLVCAAAAAAVLWSAPSARAADMIHLHDWIADLLDNNKRIQQRESLVKQSSEGVDIADGGWYPTLSATASYGYEDRQTGEGRGDTVMHPRILNLRLRQRLWDFGATDNTIDNAEAVLRLRSEEAENVRQDVIDEGVEAYLGLIRANKLLRFARASIDNIKRQTELEDARVERGSGLSTDVLQAKSRLAGAESRRVRSEGALKVAANNFLRTFNSLPPDIETMMEPAPPIDMLPSTVEGAVDVAIRENPEIHMAVWQGAVNSTQVRIAAEGSRQGLYPRLDLITDRNSVTNSAGTRGNVDTTAVRVEMTYSWNFASTAIDSLRAAEHAEVAGKAGHADIREVVEQSVRNAWDSLETARGRARHLQNQANISSEFLELARRERALGNRPITDLLTSETELINATSNAAEAETDASIAVFEVIKAMGRLTLDAIPKSDRTAALGN